MNTVICHAPGELRLLETKTHHPTADEALLRVHQVGVCGTDLHAFEGTQPYFDYPRILGHELAAEVLAVPEGSGFSPGELVTIKPYFHCGTCIACRTGKTNCCVHMKVYGVHIDGGMRSQIVVPVSSLVKAEGLVPDQLVLVEPLAIGAHGLRRAAVQPGEWALIIGVGPIGIGTMLLANEMGAKIIVMDVDAGRLKHCLSLVEGLVAIDATDPDVFQQLADCTDGDMPSVVVDCTGNRQAINTAFRYMAHGGRYVLIGLQLHDVSFNHPEFHKREGTLLSSRNATSEDFNHVIDVLQRNVILPTAFITNRLAHIMLPTEFGSLGSMASSVIKAVVTFT